jgi:hypothetical protein
MATTQPRQEFTVRRLIELTQQINEDPALVETDWRAPFQAMFEFTASQNSFLDERPERTQAVQEFFRVAASQARQGYRMRLRVVSDLTNDSRRVLQLEVPAIGLADRTIIDETSSTDSSLVFPIVCCCADCCCWHWCDNMVNPCAGS